METKIKPIPAFYCCYLLRSTIRHSSLYVGSSPHPFRRLAQHNGKSKGGAVRTSRLSLRPWEMACVVTGFPSNIAALQFEWAWQNAHLTRHIEADHRISFPVPLVRMNRKTGKTRKKPGRPRVSMVERLSNLHLLLRTTYFSQWPLELRFFCEDVHRAWSSWCTRVDSQIRPEIRIVLDLAQPQKADEEEEFSSAQRPTKRRKVDLIGKGGVEGVDPTYARYRDVLEKGRFLLDDDDEHKCGVCQHSIDVKESLFSLCTTAGCHSISHITCLAERFLQQDPTPNLLVPHKGTCPDCQNQQLWSEIMRVVSLKMRGEKEVKRLLAKRRGTKEVAAAELMDEDDDEEEDEESTMLDVDIDEGADGDDVNDRLSVSSFGSLANDSKSPTTKTKIGRDAQIVIEDSEDER